MNFEYVGIKTTEFMAESSDEDYSTVSSKLDRKTVPNPRRFSQLAQYTYGPSVATPAHCHS